MELVQERYGISERRACRALLQPRATQGYSVRVADDEEALTTALVRLASRYGRYGYRRVSALLRREGWRVNHKRVERIWRREGLKVPAKQPKRGQTLVYRRLLCAPKATTAEPRVGLRLRGSSYP